MDVNSLKQEQSYAERFGGDLLRRVAPARPAGLDLPPATAYSGRIGANLAMTFVTNDPIPPLPGEFLDRTWQEAQAEGWLRPGVFTKAREKDGKQFLRVIEIKAVA